MAFDQKELEIIQYGKENQKSKVEILSALSKYRKSQKLTATAPTEQDINNQSLASIGITNPEGPSKIASFIGGEALARGIGKAIAKPFVQKDTQTQLNTAKTSQEAILSELDKAIADGRTQDAQRIAQSLRGNIEQFQKAGGQLTDFAETVPTSKEIVGSTLKLATTAAAGNIARGASAGLTRVAPNLARGVGVGAGAAKGAIIGATTGAAEGLGRGTATALEEDMAGKDFVIQVGQEVLGTAAAGAALGGIFGAIGGGIKGRAARKEQKIIEYATPKASELTPTEYEELVRRGRIEPKTTTKPATYRMTDREAEALNLNKDIIKKDPVVTSRNITNRMAQRDAEVGEFLKKNNAIFNDGELRNQLTDKLADIDDITIDEARVSKLKEKLINNFVDGVDKNNMEGLWQARKEFDQAIDSAFKGSPSLQKDIKKALRNAVQEFIIERTPDTVYADKMREMAGLYDLLETVGAKATKERALSGLAKFIKDNPNKAKVIGGTAAFITLGLAGNQILGRSE